MGENNESIIDLTDSSFTLADHSRLNNIVINIDDSFRDDTSNANNTTTSSRAGRKRRHARTIITIDPEIPVHDLCTPENKPKRKSKSNKVADKVSVNIAEAPVEDPKEKKAKLQSACCPICFEEFSGQALAATICGHVFCTSCLKKALRRQSRCPTCRTVLKGNFKYHSIFL